MESSTTVPNQTPNQATTISPARSGNEVVSAGEKKRIANTAEQLIFYTNTDECGYPIYLTQLHEVYIKRRPSSNNIIAAFVLKSVSDFNGELNHQLLEVARRAIEEISKKKVEKELKIELVYEVYRGDMETFLGEAKAYCIKLVSTESTYSGVKYEGKKAWAIGFDWVRRISAKYPQLNGFVYVKGEEGSKGRAYVNVHIKLPITTAEFAKLFNKALAVASVEEEQLDKQIETIEKLIQEKERELSELKVKLQELIKQKQIPGRIVSMVK
jgi:hypothetical protein